MSTLSQWLTDIGLGEYLPQFRQNKIDLEVIHQLSDADLKDLGLALGDRRRFLQAATALSAAPSSAVSGAVVHPDRERRQLTIMFCDLVGSTALAASLDPEVLSGLMQAYRKAASDVVARYEGYVAQYLGDGLMIYFGWPRAHEDDAVRAVQCALEILAALPGRARTKGGDAAGSRIQSSPYAPR